MYTKMEFKQNILSADGAGGMDGGAPAPEPAPEPAPAPAPEPTPAPAAVVPPTSPQTLEWSAIKGNIAEELRSDTTMEPIQSLDGLVKGFIHAQKAMGKERIAIPDKHATKDDMIAVMRKLGSPENFDEYKVNVQEKVDDGFLKGFKESAHKAGLLPWQAEEVIDYIVQNAKTDIENNKTTLETNYDQDLGKLKSEWGEAFDENVKKAEYALKEFMPNLEDREAFIEAGFGADTRVVKMLANASKLMTEDQFLGHGSGKFAKISPQEAHEKVLSIMGDNTHPSRNSKHPNHKAAKEEVANLWKVAFPG